MNIKFLFIYNKYFTEKTGGVEKYSIDLGDDLKDNGIKTVDYSYYNLVQNKLG